MPRMQGEADRDRPRHRRQRPGGAPGLGLPELRAPVGHFLHGACRAAGRDRGRVVLSARTLDRLRKNFWHLHIILKELRASQEPEAKLAAWKEAERPSMGWRKAREY